MSSVLKLGVIRLNYKRQPVIEALATRVCRTNLLPCHLTPLWPMGSLSPPQKQRQLRKIDFSSEPYLIAFEIEN